ncbi:MAG: hypothetical protein AAGA45_01430, partial [Verrucomicrobiota bacterium]
MLTIKRRLLELSFFLLFLLLAAPLQANPDTWQDAYEKAFARSILEEKPVLFIITGNDFNKSSQKLATDVIDKGLIEQRYGAELILLHIDVTEEQLSEQMKQYDSLLYPYGPEILPKTMLCDKRGKPFVVFEGERFLDSSEEYLETLAMMLQELPVVEQAVIEAPKLEGEARLNALVESIKHLRSQPIILVRHHSSTLLDIYELIGPNEEFGVRFLMTEKLRNILSNFSNITGKEIDDLLADSSLTLYDRQVVLLNVGILFIYKDEAGILAEVPFKACLEESYALDPKNSYTAMVFKS